MSGSVPIRVVVSGPDGHTGRDVVAGLQSDPAIDVVGGIRRGDTDVAQKLQAADVLVDFTTAEAAPELMLRAIEAGVRPVSGTSGIPDAELTRVDEAARQRGIAAVWAANFSLGPVLLTHLARVAARFMDAVEVLEGHPSRKADSPSGTALALARAIRAERGADFVDLPVANALLDGIRGAVTGGVRMHSVRHPVSTMISWHEVIFTGEDGMLRLRHDDAAGYVPTRSIVRTAQEVMQTERVGLIRGYDAVIGLGDEPGA
jgi:4-hydroxy-tetrahydrodipicolinate reductase